MIPLLLADGNDPISRPLQAHRDELYRFVLSRVADASAAEDIVQEALVRAVVHQDSLRESTKIRPWLYQIVRNTIADHYRQQRPSEPIPEQFLDEADETADAERELSRCLLPLVQELPPVFREAVRLADLEGLTQNEVASRLSLSLSGAKSRVQRGRQMLRGMLLECCRVEQDRHGAVLEIEQTGDCGCGPSACCE